MPTKHALLSASSASRWLNCTPSAVLESKVKQVSSSYADEGTVAHALAELELRKQFSLITNLQYQTEFAEIEKSEYYNDSMEDYISDYVVFIVERYNEYKRPALFLEQHLSLEHYIPFGFGTSDVNIISENILDVIDLKYGKGYAVSAVNNDQMKVYALGAYHEFSYMGDIKKIRMTIYQPRIANYSTHEILVDELIQWGLSKLKPIAKIAYDGKGDLKAGEWCKFCKVKATCRAFTSAQLELAKLEFDDLESEEKITSDSTKLSDEEIAMILKKSDEFKSWITSIEKYALDQAIHNNKKWAGLKLVTGRSNRKYLDENKIIELLKKKKYDENDIMQKKIMPISKMEKFLGIEIFTKLLSKYVIKPMGALTLTNISDPRPEYNSIENTKEDFKK